MNRPPTILLVIALIFAALAGGALWVLTDRITSSGTSESTGMAGIGGPFSLIDQNGVRRTDKDFRGRYVLLYFGYTFCPDVCPTTLATIDDALPRLGPRAKRIVPVFVTIDPERDTPAVLKKYLAAFGPDFVGLTGSIAAVKKVADEYRVYFQKQKIAGGGYAMDHTSVIYLLGPDGKLVTFYDEPTKSEQLAKDLASRL